MSNGSDWLPPNARPPRDSQTSSEKKSKGYGIGEWVFAAVLGIGFLVWFTNRDSSPSRQPEVSEQLTVAEKLVIIDSNSGREHEYNRLLDSLVPKCGESRIGVSDTAVRGTEVMKEQRNISMSALEFLAAMDGAIPSGVEGMKCTEIAAALITLTDPK